MGLYNNMLLAPEKDPNAAQTETFSLDDLLSCYAEFEFQGGNTEAVNGMNDLEFEVDHLHSFTETLLNKASFYACNFVDAEGEVTVKEGPEDTLTVDVLDKDGKSLGLVDVDVWVNEALEDLELPNGGKVGDMKNYGWKEFKELEAMAQEYEETKSFTEALDAIPGDEKGDDMNK